MESLLKKIYLCALMVVCMVMMQQQVADAQCPSYQYEVAVTGNPQDPDDILAHIGWCDTMDTCWVSGNSCCCWD